MSDVLHDPLNPDSQVVEAWTDELLRIFVFGVEWFALWLDHSPLHVAWPVLFVALLQAFLHRMPSARPRARARSPRALGRIVAGG